MMNFNEFKSTVEAQIKDFLPSDYADATVEVNEVVKNNDTKLHGIVIRKLNNPVAPCIYLESFYEKYEDGYSLNDVLYDIANMRVQNERQDINADDFCSWDKVKDKVVVKLINKNMSGDYLKDKPHKTFEDLATVYMIEAFSSDNGSGHVAVSDKIFAEYNITLDELHDAAMNNLIKQFDFKGMRELLISMGLPEQMIPVDDAEMYVLTTQNKMFGASLILSDTIMKTIREKIGRDFVIIPSSIHEVIILPIPEESMNMSDITEMINSVNSSSLESVDVLSDHPYLYTKNNGIESIR